MAASPALTAFLQYVALATLAPLLAAALPFLMFRRGGIGARSLQLMFGVSAGLLFAIATLDLVPESIELAQAAAADDAAVTAAPGVVIRAVAVDDEDVDGAGMSSVHEQPQPAHDEHLEQHYAHTHAHSHAHAHAHAHNVDGVDGDDEDDDAHSHSHSHANPSNIPMLGLALGFFSLIVLEQLMAASGHAHSHGVPHDLASSGGGGGSGVVSSLSSSGEKLRSPHVLLNELDERDRRISGFASVAFLGLAIHSFVDGLVIAGAFEASFKMGSRVALAILFHKLPDGFVMASFAATQKSSFSYVLGIAAMTPLGALLGLVALQGIPRTALSFILGFGSGTFLYITACGIVPELGHGSGSGSGGHSHGASSPMFSSQRILPLIYLAAGYALFAVLNWEHHH